MAQVKRVQQVLDDHAAAIGLALVVALFLAIVLATPRAGSLAAGGTAVYVATPSFLILAIALALAVAAMLVVFLLDDSPEEPPRPKEEPPRPPFDGEAPDPASTPFASHHAAH